MRAGKRGTEARQSRRAGIRERQHRLRSTGQSCSQLQAASIADVHHAPHHSDFLRCRQLKTPDIRRASAADEAQAAGWIMPACPCATAYTCRRVGGRGSPQRAKDSALSFEIRPRHPGPLAGAAAVLPHIIQFA